MPRDPPAGPSSSVAYQGLMDGPAMSAMMNASMAFSLFLMPHLGPREVNRASTIAQRR